MTGRARLLAELKRRNVFRVGAAYAVVAWLLIEVSDTIFPRLGLPDWTVTFIIVLLLLGLPLALFLSWAYELTPEGVKRSEEVAPDASVAPTGRRLDRLILIGALGVIALLVTERVWFAGRDVADSSAPVDSVHALDALDTPATATPGKSIAVLPFVNMSDDAGNEYFADGLSEELLNLLASVRDLSVASRTSAFGYKGKDAPIPEIARALGVRYVLEGSVRKVGERVRITAQLIDAGQDRHLWSQTYDRTLSDIFAIQDEIAAAIGGALRVQLLGRSGALVRAETLDPTVYATFLEARYTLRRRSQADIAVAIALLENVVAQEPGFAAGRVALGEAYLLFGGIVVPGRAFDRAFLLKAREQADLAEQLDPDLSGIALIRSELSVSEGRSQAAIDHLSRAIELEPGEPRPWHWRGIVYSRTGHLDRARSDLLEALRLEPNNANIHGYLSNVEAALGRYDAAVALAHRQALLGNPDVGYRQASYYELLRGNFDAASSLLAERDRLGGHDPAWSAWLIAASRNSAQAGPRAHLNADSDGEELDRAFAASLVLGLDDVFLAHGADATRGEPDVVSMMWSPSRAGLRRDARFMEVMRACGALEVWRNLGPPPDCRADGERFTCGHGYPEGYAE